MERLRRRKWKPAVVAATGKWFTGYQNTVDETFLDQETPRVISVDVDHKMQYLHLTTNGFSRGRSAATFEFKDKDDFTYAMSMSGTLALLVALEQEIVEKSDQLYHGWRLPCVQTKQGANFFIEVFYI